DWVALSAIRVPSGVAAAWALSCEKPPSWVWLSTIASWAGSKPVIVSWPSAALPKTNSLGPLPAVRLTSPAWRGDRGEPAGRAAGDEVVLQRLQRATPRQAEVRAGRFRRIRRPAKGGCEQLRQIGLRRGGRRYGRGRAQLRGRRG